MGDRALVQFKDKDDTISPVIYLHWNGTEVKYWLEEWYRLIQGRQRDLDYGCARFVGICHSHIEGNLSLGVNYQPTELTADDSHGDAGCFVVNVSTGEVTASGGYGESFQLKEETIN